ncbi:MAG: ABC transporter substrate-binding protein [Rhodocyclaceae bacterium]|nr:ABC transporter substrate-binding protein [Rhodocyclaceae bacterium]
MWLRRVPGEAVSTRDLLIAALPILAAVALCVWIMLHFARPLPPDTIVLSTGTTDGAYHAFALRYKALLEQRGVRLELRSSSGALENLQRLKDPAQDVDVAFVQTGLAKADENDPLVSLGSLFHEPVWVFYRSEATLDRLIQLVSMHVAVGPAGSGTRALADMLLAANQLSPDMLTLSPLGGEQAGDALLAGRLDAAIFVAAPESTVIQKLIQNPDIKLMSFAIADAYSRRFPFLTALTLPQGSMDLVHEYPRQNTQLFAPTATLVARDDMHPALINLLLQAATEVHNGAGPFHRAREFPAPRDGDYPLASEALRYYKSGPPFLQRYLPFWAAVLVDRLIFLILPIFAIALPMMRVMPSIYAWRIRRRIYRWYGELKFLEQEMRACEDGQNLAGFLERLDSIEDRAFRRSLPLAFQNEMYTLREHIALVRTVIAKRMPGQTTG